jgi:hypothetical protein
VIALRVNLFLFFFSRQIRPRSPIADLLHVGMPQASGGTLFNIGILKLVQIHRKLVAVVAKSTLPSEIGFRGGEKLEFFLRHRNATVARDIDRT